MGETLTPERVLEIQQKAVQELDGELKTTREQRREASVELFKQMREEYIAEFDNLIKKALLMYISGSVKPGEKKVYRTHSVKVEIIGDEIPPKITYRRKSKKLMKSR